MKIPNPNFKIQNKSQFQISKFQCFGFSNWDFGFILKFEVWILRFVLVGFCVLVIGFSFGCARTVTQIVAYGDQMIVEVTLRGTVEVNNNRYFLVLSSRSDYKVPLPSPGLIASCPEFIEPGMTPTEGTAEDYYSNFFTTWAGYIVLDSSGYSSVAGPFVLGQAISRESFANIGEVSNKIKFNFDLSRIFGSSVPNTIYFDFVAVPWPTAGAKIPADHLNSTNAYLSNAKISGSSQTVTDDQDYALDASLDILKCVVTIQ